MASVMLPYFVPLPPLRIFRTPLRVWIGIASAILLALAAACSGAGTATSAPEQTILPTPISTPTRAPTAVANAMFATPRTTGLLVNEPESFEGYTLYARNAAYLIDHMGRFVHTWEPRHEAVLARLLDNGNLLTMRNVEIDPEGNVVWEYSHPQHHDLLTLPNGNILFLANIVIPREDAIALGVNPDELPCTNFEATHIIEVRPIGRAGGEVVWQWSALDHFIQDFDPEKPNYGVVADHPELMDINYFTDPTKCAVTARDWQHANALDYNANLDQIMITSRHFSEIWIIDHSATAEEAAGHTGGNAGRGGDLLYRWGNPRAYQRGTVADQRLFWPHNAHWIPWGSPGAGNVLIFNNGNEYAGKARGYSSVDEIALPSDGYAYRLSEGSAYGPNEFAWRYVADPPESFYSWLSSGAQRLPNGNTLITDSMARRIFEVTRGGKTVWEFAHPLPERIYRAYRYAPDYPGLRSLDLTP